MSLPIPPLHGDSHDDGLYDCVSAVEAQLADDGEGLAAILANADPAEVAATALKLLAEAIVTAEQDYPPCRCHFRQWALLAVRR